MKRILILLISILLFSNLYSQNPCDKILGTYLTQDKGSKVEFYKKGNKYYGKVVWLKEPNDPKTQKPITDTENPDRSKRNQPILGMVIIEGVSFTENNTWDGGTIYDPNTGKTWDCIISSEGTNLKVKGYWKFSWIGKTEIWTKA